MGTCPFDMPSRTFSSMQPLPVILVQDRFSALRRFLVRAMVFRILALTLALSQAQNLTGPTAKALVMPEPLSDFLHCPCGASCQQDLGKKDVYSLGKNCSCTTCTVRGATAKMLPMEAAMTDQPATVMPDSGDWDAATMPGDVMYCRCGSDSQGCRSCTRTGCPCGSTCLKWRVWARGMGWCVERVCNGCR